MKKTVLKKTVLTLSLILSASTSQAGWVDDWLAQSASTQTGYFEGQQRGYYSAGSFSGRWKSTADYPVTVELPKVKSGCGGIDVFVGGMSFMNMEYLTQKLKGMVTGAVSALAYDLATKVLSEQVANSTKNIMALADTLNQMQLDECAAGKSLVGIMTDKDGLRSGEDMQNRLGTAIKENKLVSGVSNLWTGLTTEEQANGGTVNAGDVVSATSTCNQDIRDIFMTGNSMLATVGNKMNIPSSHIDLMRGLTGDIRLSGAAEAYQISYMPPCSENNSDSLKSLSSGDMYIKNTAGVCSPIIDGNRDMTAYVTGKLTSMAVKIRTKSGELNVAEKAFLDSTPISILPILKSGVGTVTEGQTISVLADMVANAYILQMMSDLYLRAEAIAVKAREVVEKKGAASNGSTETCAAPIFLENASKDIAVMLGKINSLKEGSKTNYIAAREEMIANLQAIETMKNLESQMNQEVTRRFGKDVVARVN